MNANMLWQKQNNNKKKKRREKSEREARYCLGEGKIPPQQQKVISKLMKKFIIY